MANKQRGGETNGRGKTERPGEMEPQRAKRRRVQVEAWDRARSAKPGLEDASTEDPLGRVFKDKKGGPQKKTSRRLRKDMLG